MCPTLQRNLKEFETGDDLVDREIENIGLIDWSTTLRAVLSRDHPHCLSFLKTSRATPSRDSHGRNGDPTGEVLSNFGGSMLGPKALGRVLSTDAVQHIGEWRAMKK